MSKSLVPEGALLVCNKGSDIVELKVTNEEKIFIKDKAHANEKDNKFIENIPSFKECSIFGQCEHTTFSLWQNPCPNVTVGKKAKKLIKEDSTLKCKKVSDVESSRGDFRTTSSTGEVRVFLEGQAAIDALYGNDYYESMLLKDSVNSFLAGLIPGAIIGAISCYIPGVESLMSKINPDIMVMVGAKTTADRLNSSNRTWEDFIRERGIKDEKVKEMYMKHADRVVLLENAGMFAGAYGVNKLLNLRGSSALVNEASMGNIEEGSDLASMKNVKQKGTVNWSGEAGEVNLKTPQGLDDITFNDLSSTLKNRVGDISDDIVVQGSRAAGTAKPTSDIDIGIRVDEIKFSEQIKKSFGTPNPGSAKERTMLHAVETGKIQAGEAKLSGLRKDLQNSLGMDVDISIIKIGGQFDNPPFISIK